MTRLTAYTGAEIFDGTNRHEDSALLIDGKKVFDIVNNKSVPDNYMVVSLDGGLLTAGFVDLQVNGGGGKMLNNEPNLDTIQTICNAHLKFGTTSLLPTLITDSKSITETAIAACKDAISQKVKGIIGLHLEGPHLALAKRERTMQLLFGKWKFQIVAVYANWQVNYQTYYLQ